MVYHTNTIIQLYNYVFKFSAISVIMIFFFCHAVTKLLTRD